MKWTASIPLMPLLVMDMNAKTCSETKVYSNSSVTNLNSSSMYQDYGNGF
jgi:hypothetical protein